MSFFSAVSGFNLIRPDDPAKLALARGAERLLALQRGDLGWEGSWRRYVGSGYASTNTVGLSALGLVEAYKVLRYESLLEGARRAAAFTMAHLGGGAVGAPYHPRFTGADLLLLHRLHELTGDEGYRSRAADEWRNIRGYFYFGSADELHRFFQKIDRKAGAWDLAFYLEAADLAGDITWADGVATVLSQVLGGMYADANNDYRALNLAATVRALAGQGYGGIHRQRLELLTGALVEQVEAGGASLSVQDTAQALLAFSAAGTAWRGLTGRLVYWLCLRQETWGGWMEEGVQYPHVVGEVLWALGVYLGRRGTRDRGPAPPLDPTLTRDGARWRTSGQREPVAPFDGI